MLTGKGEELIRCLSWNEDPASQNEAVALLVAGGDLLDLSQILRTGDKSCWQNEARVLLALGYPRFREVIPGMLQWLQDLNWPGSDEVVRALESTPKEELAAHVSKAVECALGMGDADWLFGLRYLARAVNLTAELIVGEEIRAALLDEEADS